MESKPRVDLRPIRRRLRELQATYNPDRQNLHFASLAEADAELFDRLLAIAGEALSRVREDRDFFLTHSLYDDGMVWYDLFLVISASSWVCVLSDPAQRRPIRRR